MEWGEVDWTGLGWVRVTVGWGGVGRLGLDGMGSVVLCCVLFVRVGLDREKLGRIG